MSMLFIAELRLVKQLELQRGYGATVARLTPDQTVGRSNRSGLIFFSFGYAVGRFVSS